MEKKWMKADKISRRKVVLLVVGLFLFFSVAGLVLVFWFERRVHYVPSDKIREEDVSALTEGDYEAVILSMYTPESFDAEEFGYFRGISTVQAFHSFVNLADMADYLQQGFSGNDNLSNVYIGLDPFEISKLYGFHTALYADDYEKYLSEYVRMYSDVIFEFLIPAYSMDYMRSLSGNEFAELINSYRNLVNIYQTYDNVVIYYLGYEQWLVANPGNYVSPTICNPSVLRRTVAHTLRDDKYALTPNNMEECFARVTELVLDTPITYPDLSEWCMVFFGESPLEYYTGSYSITGVVNGLSGAQVYNCGKGGVPATDAPAATLSLNRMITRFLEQDTDGLEDDNNFVVGLTAYMQEDHENKKYCFVVAFGLNDYFGGHPVENPEDGYDVGTYAGALRSGIRTLKEAYPDAEILLMAPTYTALFSEGTEKNSEVGGVFTDYVDATVRVAEEMDVLCMNNYADSGINAENHTQYLTDGCHPTETGALLLGTQIVEYMGRVAANEE